ncbi:FtsX-like permease family protein [Kitasatospora sp. GAS1066B]|uniref:FtsX-like permease family protein n=1 Tax=Kitasatospora sp. GAS1066B TaxID=3156271 RepID=UPI003518C880
MLRTVLRNALAHKARLLMTALAVLLGVAFLSATLTFAGTVSGAYQNSLSNSVDNNAVAITLTPGQYRQAQGSLDAGLLQKVAALPGVAFASGSVFGFAAVADQAGRPITPPRSSIGANYIPGGNGTDARYHMTDGRGPQSAEEIALDRSSAGKAHYRVGDMVPVSVNGPVLQEKLVGTFTTDDPKVSAGGSLVLFDTPTAQSLYLSPGHFSQITLSPAAGASRTQLLTDVQPLLPPDGSATAQSGQSLANQQSAITASSTEAVRNALLAFAGIALFVGVFGIANTFNLSAVRRTRELALVRAIGATRAQVTASIMAEAFLVGTVASILGALLGVAIASAVRAGLDATGSHLPSGPLVVSPGGVAASLVLGVLVSMLAAWLSARRAATIAPVAAMRGAQAQATRKSRVLRGSASAALTTFGVLTTLFGAWTGNRSGMGVLAVGAPFTMMGVIVLTPILTRPVTALAARPLTRLWGPSGTLARRNAARNPRRTAATASALSIGLALVCALAVVGVSLTHEIDRRSTQGLRADYQIGMATPTPLDPSVAPALARTPAVTAVSALQSTDLHVADQTRSVTAVDPTTIAGLLDLTTTSGTASTLQTPNTVLVKQSTAAANGWTTGSQIPAIYPDGTRATLTVGGVVAPNRLLSDLVLSHASLAAHGVELTDQAVLLSTKDGANTKNRQALLNALGNNPIIQVKDHEQLRMDNEEQLSLLLDTVYGMLALTAIIAILGLVNTLTLSVFEHPREIGLLRAIGLEKANAAQMIRLESALTTLLGAGLGLGLGIFLAWAICRAAPMTLILPWGSLALILATTALVCLSAALWPARRAARLHTLLP